MTTAAEAQAAIRTRAAANFTALPLRYKNEPDTIPSAAFVYVELLIERTAIVAFGGGRGANLQRSFGRIEAQVLVPKGSGMIDGLAHAETFCAVFRGQRVDGLSYFAAEAFPASGQTDDGAYELVATAIVDLQFDKSA